MGKGFTQIAFFRAFDDRTFNLLWSGQLLSRVGDHLYEIALAWWVLEKTGSATAMATVLVFSFVPMVIFTLPGGIIVDRFPRLQVMLVADIVRGIAILILGLLAMSDGLHLWHVYVLSIIVGTMDAFFNPAYMAIIPELVPENNLPSANSLTSLSIQIGRIAGPPLGAVLVAVGGVSLAFILNALSFLIGALFLLPLLRITKLKALDEESPAEVDNSGNMLADLRALPGLLREFPWLLGVISLFALTNIALAGPYSVSLPFLVKDHFLGNVEVLGLLYALFAVGYVIGSIWAGNQTQLPRRGRLLFIGTAIAGLMLMAFGLTDNFVLLAVAAMSNGAALQVASLAWTNILQTEVPPEKLGRVASIDALGSFALLPLGYVVAGYATELMGASNVFLLGGGIVALVAFIGYRQVAQQLDKNDA